MLSHNQIRSALTIVALLICLTYVAFSQTPSPTPTPKSTPRKTFGIQIEVISDSAAKVEGAKVILASEEEGVKFNKERRTTKEGVVNFSQVPQGRLKVQVVAKEFDTFGEIFNLTQDNQTIRITVKKRINPT
jgi:hypothetical protein